MNAKVLNAVDAIGRLLIAMERRYVIQLNSGLFYDFTCLFYEFVCIEHLVDRVDYWSEHGTPTNKNRNPRHQMRKMRNYKNALEEA